MDYSINRFNWLVVVAITTLVTLNSCDKWGDAYRITGTLYDTDEITPLAGIDLELIGSNTMNFNNYETTLAQATTDKNGQFEFVYKHDRKALWVDINTASGKLLLNDGANYSFHRDVCLKAVGYVHFNLDIQRDLEQNDSIFIEIPDNDVITSLKKGSINLVTYPFEELKRFEKVSLSWSRASGDFRSVRWGLGWEDFQVNGGQKVGEDGYYVNSERFYLTGFPHVDTVNITLK